MRVALITSEPVFRLGFRSAIKSSGDLHLIADAGDARAGFQSHRRTETRRGGHGRVSQRHEWYLRHPGDHASISRDAGAAAR